MKSFFNYKIPFGAPKDWPEKAIEFAPFPRLFLVIIVFLFGIVSSMFNEAVKDNWVLTVMLWAGFPLILSGMLWDGVRLIRLGRTVKRCDKILCTKCAYDMRGLTDIDSCPECGKNWQKDYAVRQWSVFLRGEMREK